MDWGVRLAKATENTPTDGDVNRLGEIHTSNFEGVFMVEEYPFPALVYQCAQNPPTLRDVLLTTKKPSPEDRRILGGTIATQIQPLNFHFRLPHAGLRTENFIFFGDLEKPYLTNAYVLDWGHSSSPSIYEYLEYQDDQPSGSTIFGL